MAKRKVFLSTKNGNQLVKSIEIEFKWFPGLSISQKQKSVESLHSAFKLNYNFSVLEVSTKSNNELGVSLSAFNLTYTSKIGVDYCVESLFQGSKVFVEGGPYIELYSMKGREAKKRIKELSIGKGNLVGFKYKDVEWPIYPKTAFYDWLYMKMLLENPDIIHNIMNFEAFTDIEFNDKKSINCQAYSLAMFVSLKNRNLLHILNSREEYLKFVSDEIGIREAKNGQLFLGDI